MNDQSHKVYLSHTHTGAHTHTYCSKSACHNSWYLSRRAMTLTDAEGASAPQPGLMYIKGNAWLVLAPDFSRIQTMSRGFARKTYHKSIEPTPLRNLAPYRSVQIKNSIFFSLSQNVYFSQHSSRHDDNSEGVSLRCLLLVSYWTGSASRLIIAKVLIFVHRAV